MSKTLLRAEIDLEWPGVDRYPELARAWLDEGFSQLAGDHRHALLSGPKLPAAALRRSMPCGPPGAVWGFVSVDRFVGGRRREASRVITAKNLEWFLGQLADLAAGPPQQATLGLSLLDHEGYPGPWLLRMIVERPFDDTPEDLLDWLVLSFQAPEADLLAHQDRWLEFLARICNGLNPSFGNITYSDGVIGDTGLERTLGPPWLSPEETIPLTRERLRGYEWWTVCPQELAARLGGPDALRATGAFHQVRQLEAGGIWLQATEHYRDYDQRAYTAVFHALAPVLPSGTPTSRKMFRGLQEPSERVVCHDAATA